MLCKWEYSLPSRSRYIYPIMQYGRHKSRSATREKCFTIFRRRSSKARHLSSTKGGGTLAKVYVVHSGRHNGH